MGPATLISHPYSTFIIPDNKLEIDSYSLYSRMHKERIARIAKQRMKVSHVVRDEINPKHFKLHSTPARTNRIRSFI